MTTWTLILILKYITYSGSGTALTSASVPGFASERACKDAKQKIWEHTDGMVDISRGVCVEMGK